MLLQVRRDNVIFAGARRVIQHVELDEALVACVDGAGAQVSNEVCEAAIGVVSNGFQRFQVWSRVYRCRSRRQPFGHAFRCEVQPPRHPICDRVCRSGDVPNDEHETLE